MAVVNVIEPLIEPCFHEDSFGYRPHRSAHDAIAKAERRCWKYAWVLDIDISKFFDTIDHGLLMKAVEKHINIKWILLYIKRWLTVPYQRSDGEIVILNPTQIKSADPVTYDDGGNIIPLSQRFDSSSDDIRY